MVSQHITQSSDRNDWFIFVNSPKHSAPLTETDPHSIFRELNLQEMRISLFSVHPSCVIKPKELSLFTTLAKSKLMFSFYSSETSQLASPYFKSSNDPCLTTFQNELLCNASGQVSITSGLICIGLLASVDVIGYTHNFKIR